MTRGSCIVGQWFASIPAQTSSLQSPRIAWWRYSAFTFPINASIRCRCHTLFASAIGNGKFHQRCDCKQPEHYCKAQCDASEACKGWAGPIQNNVSNYWGCQFATTDNWCPRLSNGSRACALLDLDVVGDLSRIAKTRSPGYLGCHVKLSRMPNLHNYK